MSGTFWTGVGILIAGFALSVFLSCKERREGDKDWKWSLLAAFIGLLGGGLAAYESVGAAAENERLNQKVGDAERKANAASDRADQVRHDLTRRDLAIQAIEGQELRKAMGTRVRLWHEAGDEPKDVAAELRKALEHARWEVVEVLEVDGELLPGIRVERSPFPQNDAEKKQAEVAELLASAISKCQMVAEAFPGTGEADLLVLIGASERLKPPHVLRIPGLEARNILKKLPPLTPGKPRFGLATEGDELFGGPLFDGLTVKLSYSAESEPLAKQIGDGLKKSGWPVETEEYDNANPVVGVQIETRSEVAEDSRRAFQAASRLLTQLNRQGITPLTMSGKDFSDPNLIRVIVGSFPASDAADQSPPANDDKPADK